MEENKNKNENFKNVLIIVLLICIFVLGGLLVYKELNTKKESDNNVIITNNTSNNINTNTETNTNSSFEPIYYSVSKKTNMTGNIEFVQNEEYMYQVYYNNKLIKEYHDERDPYMFDGSIKTVASKEEATIYAYQIDKVIIVQFPVMHFMCDSNVILIFNEDGNILFDSYSDTYKDYDLSNYTCNEKEQLKINNKSFVITYIGGSCVSTGDDAEMFDGPSLEFSIEGSNLNLVKYNAPKE